MRAQTMGGATFSPVDAVSRRSIPITARPAGRALTPMTAAQAQVALAALAMSAGGFVLGSFLGYRVITRACASEE